MIERIADRIERELDVVEMVDAAPSVIRRLKAQRVARAALEALREPTSAMHSAGNWTQHDNDQTGVCDIWRAMIDAALSDSDRNGEAAETVGLSPEGESAGRQASPK